MVTGRSIIAPPIAGRDRGANLFRQGKFDPLAFSPKPRILRGFPAAGLAVAGFDFEET